MAMSQSLVTPVVIVFPPTRQGVIGTVADNITAPSLSTNGTVTELPFACRWSAVIVMLPVTLKFSMAGKFAFNVHERPVYESYTAFPAPGPLK